MTNRMKDTNLKKSIKVTIGLLLALVMGAATLAAKSLNGVDIKIASTTNRIIRFSLVSFILVTFG